MARPSRDDPNTELADKLHSAAIHVLRRVRTEDDALGLTAPRLSALSVLVFRGPLTIGELARAEQVTAATTSRLVTGLEAAGLARRVADPSDGRLRRVEPTPEGAALLMEGRRRRVARLAASLDRLSVRERGVLARAVELLEEILRPPKGEGGRGG